MRVLALLLLAIERSTACGSLGDYLEEGLAELGYSCDETEIARL
jgi:hypothetical protein